MASAFPGWTATFSRVGAGSFLHPVLSAMLLLSPHGLPPGPAVSSSEKSWFSLFQTADYKFTPAKGHLLQQLSRVCGEETFESEKCKEQNNGPGPAGGLEGSARLN